MEFGILGPLQISDSGRVEELSARKLRVLLTVLLLNANRPVLTDQLIEALWGETPPASADNTLQSYVSHIRKAFEQGSSRPGDDRLIQTASPATSCRSSLRPSMSGASSGSSPKAGGR